MSAAGCPRRTLGENGRPHDECSSATELRAECKFCNRTALAMILSEASTRMKESMKIAISLCSLLRQTWSHKGNEPATPGEAPLTNTRRVFLAGSPDRTRLADLTHSQPGVNGSLTTRLRKRNLIVNQP